MFLKQVEIWTAIAPNQAMINLIDHQLDILDPSNKFEARSIEYKIFELHHLVKLIKSYKQETAKTDLFLI